MANGVAALDFEKPIVELEKKIEEVKSLGKNEKIDFSKEIIQLEKKCKSLKKKVFSSLTPWQRVQLARHPLRPYSLDYSFHFLKTSTMPYILDKHACKS